LMGSAVKTLLVQMTPAMINDPQSVVSQITWKSTSTSTNSDDSGDLTEAEQQFKAIFEAWIAKPGHPNHPNVIEHIGVPAFEQIKHCVHFRARCFSKQVHGTDTLASDYT
ncbi:hypothetical protein V5O48_019732, partial [Marasmius crinis-equi]